jgi:lipopolysaccharide/colanic/teichoic acid biosynthesis glycosyltransferase
MYFTVEGSFVMNDIIKIEQNNSGQTIHCHYLSNQGTWVAYGKSAYGLQDMVSRAGCPTIDKYSIEADMACVMVGHKTLTLICAKETRESHEPHHLCIDYTSDFSDEEYNSWVDRVRKSSAKKNNRWVQTLVSDEIAEQGVIKDGMSAFERTSKRALDFIFALVAIIIFAPLFVITYIAVRCEDGGPAIFKQERIGRFGHPFFIYKFRSMRLDAEKNGPQLSHTSGKHDNRLTKVGRFIRAHHLDELPQLWNVLCGDMAFIGPRPERKFYIDQIMEYDKRYEYLYQIRPGVTSYATLYNGYTDTMEKMLKRLEFDLYYMCHRSTWFDIKILFFTFCSIVFGKKF